MATSLQGSNTPDRIGDLRRALTGPRCISAAALIVLLLGVLTRNLVRDQVGESPQLTSILVVALCGAMAAAAATALCALTLLRNRRSSPVSLWRVLLAYIVISIALSGALVSAGHVVGVTIPSSPVRVLFAIGFLVVMAYVLDTYDTYKDAVVELRAERLRLVDSRDTSLSHNAAVRLRLQSLVTSNLGAQISAVQQRLAAARATNASPVELRKLSATLRSIADDRVRPLSHDFSAQRSMVQPPPVAEYRVQAPRQRGSLVAATTEIVQAIPDARPFRPVVVALTFLAAILSNGVTSTTGTPRGAVFLLAATVASAVIAGLGQWSVEALTRRRRSRWTRLQRALLLCVTYPAIAVVAAIPLGVAASAPFEAPVVLLVLGGAIGVVACSLVWATIGAVSDRATRTLAQLAEAVDHVRWEAQRCEQEEVRLLTATSTALHGEIQSKLTMTALLLIDAANRAEAGDNGLNATLETACLTLSDVSKAVATATAESDKTIGIYAELQLIGGTWRGVAVVYVDVEPDLALVLDAAPATARALVEIVRESVANSVRHGKARTINVRLVASGDRVLAEVTDDGVGTSSVAQPGLGFTLYDRLTSAWDLRDLEVGAHFTGELPMVPSVDNTQGAAERERNPHIRQ